MFPPRRAALVPLAVAFVVAVAPAAAAHGNQDARLERALETLVARRNGPPGAIALVHRGGDTHVFRTGVSNVRSGAPIRPWLHMRIASTAKAYSGAVALSLVESGELSLDDTIGELLAWAPEAWAGVTLAQALHHTSGLPDFSKDRAFQDAVLASLDEPDPPRRLLGYVEHKDLRFDPGSRYHYSNSDNIVVALMAEAVTGERYPVLLQQLVDRPLGLRDTTLPRGVEMPRPYLRGYDLADDGTPEDVSELLAAGWAWASGGVVSTPLDQLRFIRGYVGRELFGANTQAAQFAFADGGKSEPTGPGSNAAGLAIFRYRLPCGTVFGHTGNTLGYTQFFAASRSGERAVVVSVNLQTTPDVRPDVFRDLREVFARATCAAFSHH